METELLIEKEIENEEKCSSLAEILVSPKKFEWIKEEVLVAIIKIDACEGVEGLSSLEICGKTLESWVRLATQGPKQIVFENESYAEILSKLKEQAEGKKYVFLTYSDLAYLQRKTFLDVMYYFSSNGLASLALPKGFVFKTEHLLGLSKIEASFRKSFGTNDFEEINTSQKISEFHKYLSNKIRKFHKENGVVLLGEETIFIDADVEIESGVVVHPNNVISGQTFIGKNAVIESGNVICDSIISERAVIKNSNIYRSKVAEGQIIGPFANLKNESV